MRYFKGTGRYQGIYDDLKVRIPTEGECKNKNTSNKHLEELRKAVNQYFDLYENGLTNRHHGFKKQFSWKLEDMMDAFILHALVEQHERVANLRGAPLGDVISGKGGLKWNH
jgi:archaellum component FlaC